MANWEKKSKKIGTNSIFSRIPEREATSPTEGEIASILRNANTVYKHWFTSQMASGYINSLRTEYMNAKDEEYRLAILNATKQALGIYSFLVYYAYPERPGFKEEIDSSPELSTNFKAVKAWLDENGGQKLADDVVQGVRSAVMQAEEKS